MVPDTNLVPAIPSNGCPSGTSNYNDISCCCGGGCCWDSCSWSYPNDNCLNDQNYDFWMWDSTKQTHVAQTRKFRYVLMLNNESMTL